jgi:arylsulfatase A-like enzyme
MNPIPRHRENAKGCARLLLVLVLLFVANGSSGLGCADAPSSAPRGILLIVLDTLRADRLGSYGAERPTSPELDSWVRSGRVYERALAPSPWTLPSFASVFTGELPSRHGAGIFERGDGERALAALDTALPTLAEQLGRAGYATAAIVNNPYLDPRFGLDRGFGHYDHVSGDNIRVRRADLMVDIALAWIDARGEVPFFMVLHLFDIHMNYDPPPSVRGRFTRGHPSRMRLPVSDFRAIRSGRVAVGAAEVSFISAAYDEEVLFVDGQLGRLRRGLEERGLLDDLLIVLTSDHGEELFDHDGFEHGHAMWQELLHVPLVFWGPFVLAGRESSPVSLVDLYPTLLEAVGIQTPEQNAGRSLWSNLLRGDSLRARTLHAEGILFGPERKVALRWPYKLVLDAEKPRHRLFDLEDDPGERVGIGKQRRDVARQLTATLRALESVTPPSPRRSVRLDSEIRENLRALGYVE